MLFTTEDGPTNGVTRAEHGDKRRVEDETFKLGSSSHPCIFPTVGSTVKAAGGVAHRPSVAAVDDVRVPAGRPHVAEHEEHEGDHHGQQEPLGVQPAGGVASAVVLAAVAPHAAARSRSHGLQTRTPSPGRARACEAPDVSFVFVSVRGREGESEVESCFGRGERSSQEAR